jgi:lysophospholipid acyltransferase
MKRYYDFVSYLATQLTFSFAVAPFLVLGFWDSLRVWGHVYFYAIICTGLSMLFFSSSGKTYLKEMLDSRQARAGVKLVRTASQESMTSHEPVLGLSADPEREFVEAMQDIKAEVEARKK